MDKVYRVLDKKLNEEVAQYVSSYWMAGLYGAMGDMDKAFELLNKACEERIDWLINLKVDLSLGPYHRDPRYKTVLKKMGWD